MFWYMMRMVTSDDARQTGVTVDGRLPGITIITLATAAMPSSTGSTASGFTCIISSQGGGVGLEECDVSECLEVSLGRRCLREGSGGE